MKRRNPPEKCLRCNYSLYNHFGDLSCSCHIVELEDPDSQCLVNEPKTHTCANCVFAIKENNQLYCFHKNNKIEVFEYECCRDHTNFD